jgi:hypothetical protein
MAMEKPMEIGPPEMKTGRNTNNNPAELSSARGFFNKIARNECG